MHSELINKLFDVKDKLSDAEYKSLVDCIAECESKKTSTEYYELHYLEFVIREESIRQEDDTRIFTQCVYRKQKNFNISLIRKYILGDDGCFTTLEEMKRYGIGRPLSFHQCMPHTHECVYLGINTDNETLIFTQYNDIDGFNENDSGQDIFIRELPPILIDIKKVEGDCTM